MAIHMPSLDREKSRIYGHLDTISSTNVRELTHVDTELRENSQQLLLLIFLRIINDVAVVFERCGCRICYRIGKTFTLH